MFIAELERLTEENKNQFNSVDELSERVASKMRGLGYALATPRFVKDYVIGYLKAQGNKKTYNLDNYIT